MLAVPSASPLGRIGATALPPRARACGMRVGAIADKHVALVVHPIALNVAPTLLIQLLQPCLVLVICPFSCTGRC